MTDVHPNLQPFLKQLNLTRDEQKAHGVEMTPALARDNLATLTANFVTSAPAIAGIKDLNVSTMETEVPVRLYDPEPGFSKSVIVFFHGGGHMAGSVAVYDFIARKLAKASGMIVLSVDYRLSPETPYPGGLNDCLAVTRQVWQILEREQIALKRRLALAGDSAGAAYAATISQRLAGDTELALSHQVLIYPSVDYTMQQPSITANGNGYLLEKQRIQWYFDHYFAHGEDRCAASPLHMEVPSEMPKTLVITAGYCPLHDEDVAYVRKLEENSVPCQLKNYPDMIHAYLNLEDLVPDVCADTYQTIGEFLQTEEDEKDSNLLR